MGDSFFKIENEERKYMHKEYHFALTRFLVSLNSKSCKKWEYDIFFYNYLDMFYSIKLTCYNLNPAFERCTG